MNLEDFKSFRRVLKPSEVGSIPTHSRQRAQGGRVLRGVVVILTALAWNAAARAQSEEAQPPAQEAQPPAQEAQRPAQDLPRPPSPGNRAARSAIFPAWGQLTNGRPVKAAALFALETYLATGIIVETRRGESKRRFADAAPDEATELLYDGLADAHFDRRRNLIFWSLLAVFYGVADAYVDAHLGEFDREIHEGRELFGKIDRVERTIELGVRF